MKIEIDKIKFTDEEIETSFVVMNRKENSGKFLFGQVQDGSFASSAWLCHSYDTITDRLEVLWADDCQVANARRNMVTRVQNRQELCDLVNENGNCSELFARWLTGDETVKQTIFGLRDTSTEL